MKRLCGAAYYFARLEFTAAERIELLVANYESFVLCLQRTLMQHLFFFNQNEHKYITKTKEFSNIDIYAYFRNMQWQGIEPLCWRV